MNVTAIVWCRGCRVKATKIQTHKNLNMKKEDSKTEQPCAIQNVVRSGFDLKKFNIDLNKAKMQFAKACNNYLNSKEHKAMIEAFKKVGAIG